MTETSKYLDFLNNTYFKLHKNYEDLFWISYMGDHSVDTRKDEALSKRDSFRANPDNLEKVNLILKTASKVEKEKILYWKNFFSRYQTP
ncbi:MAG TPA: hypothetical protein VGC58_02435, partial [Candidatus Paceibacterota bacterium]